VPEVLQMALDIVRKMWKYVICGIVAMFFFGYQRTKAQYQNPYYLESAAARSHLAGDQPPHQIELMHTMPVGNNSNSVRRIIPLTSSNYCNWSYPSSPGRPYDWFAAHMASKLAFIGHVLTVNGIVWWVDYGTLLGIVRHGGQIPFVDWDADLVIPSQFFDASVAALAEATKGTNFFVGRISRTKPSVGKHSAAEPRVSIGSRDVTQSCRAHYNTSYPGVLDGDHPWHVDISFATHQDRLSTRFCHCMYYDKPLVCPSDALDRLHRMYSTSWYYPDACKTLPREWCTTAGAHKVKGNVFPVVNVKQDDPQASSDQLALCGIHPWLRISNISTWCRHSSPKDVLFKKNRRGHGEIYNVYRHACIWPQSRIAL
jgi:hypothetical protein